MIVAALGSVLTSFAILFLTTVDLVHLAGQVYAFAENSLGTAPAGHFVEGSESPGGMARELLAEKNRTETVVRTVQLIDGYLLAAIMLIFGFGIYELFVSELDDAKSDHNASRLLEIKTMDELKGRLGKVVILILVVKFFEIALQMKFSGPVDLVYLSVGTVLLGVTLHLSHKGVGGGAGSEGEAATPPPPSPSANDKD